MSFLFSWVWDALSYFGLYSRKAKILFIGLDNAGKTTLMHMLRDDRLALHAPTFHPTAEELMINNIRIQAIDLGGHESGTSVHVLHVVRYSSMV